jgi:hypothetical protein
VRTVRRDEETGLALVVDRRDPPRYYLSTRKRVDLLCIGDVQAALDSFEAEVKKAQARRKPPAP